MQAHIPVLLEGSIDLLCAGNGKTFVDGTVNGGGHSDLLLKKMKPNGVLVGIDRDAELLKKVTGRFKDDKRFKPVLGNFRNMKELVRPYFEKADGIILDLGMSSAHLEGSGRGFSFKADDPLDMRYDYVPGEESALDSASDILNNSNQDELADIFKRYGEERFSWRIAKAIVRARQKAPIEKVSDLVGIIQRTVPRMRSARIHPATRVFQALRIAVNDELGALQEGLDGAWSILNDGGRIAVISYHSLEDRIVKHTFRKFHSEDPSSMILTKKPIRPSEEEREINPRSRSAKLRVIQK